MTAEQWWTGWAVPSPWPPKIILAAAKKKKIKNFDFFFKILANNTKKITFNTRIHLVRPRRLDGHPWRLCSEHVTCHVSHVTCHVSCVTCHMSRSEHSLHGCPSSRLSLTKCILVLNVFFFLYYLPRFWNFFWNVWFFFLQNTSYSYGHGRPAADFFFKVIPRPWPVADVLAVHHCCWGLNQVRFWHVCRSRNSTNDSTIYGQVIWAFWNKQLILIFMARFSKLFILILGNSSSSGAHCCTFVLTTRWKAQRIALFIETFGKFLVVDLLTPPTPTMGHFRESSYAYLLFKNGPILTTITSTTSIHKERQQQPPSTPKENLYYFCLLRLRF